VFPFRVLFPITCPSSAKFKGGNSSKASVRYHISAFLIPHQSQKVKPISCKANLLVCQHPYEITYEPMKEKVIKIKKFMFFGDKGAATLNVVLDKTVYDYSEDINVKVNIDNSNCSEDITKIKVKLRQHVRFTSNWGYYHEQIKIWENTFEGMPKKTATDGYGLTYTIPLMHAKNKNLKDVDQAKEVYFFLDGIQPTTIGNNVNVFYTIKVKCEYSNLAAKKLIVIHPVIIQAPDLSQEYVPCSIKRKFIILPDLIGFL
jgi:hypothetical protein